MSVSKRGGKRALRRKQNALRRRQAFEKYSSFDSHQEALRVAASAAYADANQIFFAGNKNPNHTIIRPFHYDSDIKILKTSYLDHQDSPYQDRQRILEEILDYPHTSILTATNPQPLGIIITRRSPACPLPLLEWLFVVPPYRHAGIGQSLILNAYEEPHKIKYATQWSPHLEKRKNKWALRHNPHAGRTIV